MKKSCPTLERFKRFVLIRYEGKSKGRFMLSPTQQNPLFIPYHIHQNAKTTNMHVSSILDTNIRILSRIQSGHFLEGFYEEILSHSRRIWRFIKLGVYLLFSVLLPGFAAVYLGTIFGSLLNHLYGLTLPLLFFKNGILYVTNPKRAILPFKKTN